jgi:hypothetical protein
MFSHPAFNRGLSKSFVSAARPFMKTGVPATSYVAGLLHNIPLSRIASPGIRASRFRIPRKG